jgi:hypothetical protein
MSRRTWGRGLAGTAAVLALAALLLAPLARAEYDPLGSGATRLVFDRSFLAQLKQGGVELSAVAPARLDRGVVTFPVSGGKFDSADGRGMVEHEGALLFEAGRRSIPIKAPQLKTTQRRAPFSAKVGGSQLKLATAGSLAVAREGFGDRIKASALTLSAKLVTRLSKKLRLRGVFEAGQPLGSALTRAQPVTVTVLDEGRASFTPSPEILAKLGSLSVALNPIFPAEHPGASFTLPLVGGIISPDGSQGRVETQGSLEFLQLAGGQIFWAEPWLDLATHVESAEVDAQPSPPYAGKVGRVGIAEISLVGAALSSDPRARTVTVSGASLLLGATTAASFNQAFAGGKAVFAAGEALGVLSFVAQGQ